MRATDGVRRRRATSTTASADADAEPGEGHAGAGAGQEGETQKVRGAEYQELENAEVPSLISPAFSINNVPQTKLMKLGT
jgi:hypothetical protein